jgi:hypothetical protein
VSKGSDFSAFGNELRADVATANLLRRDRIGEAVLATYAHRPPACPRQAKLANLPPHIATMKQMNPVRREARDDGSHAGSTR